jgi:hypothetical protein
VKYMLLMQATQGGWQSFGAMAPEDIRAHISFMKEINKQLRESGEMVDAQGLTGPEQARVVRATEAGPPAVTDGPFPEAKEYLAGYWLLECGSLARAIEIAAQISTAPGRGGVPMNFPVEVRAVGVAPQV